MAKKKNSLNDAIPIFSRMRRFCWRLAGVRTKCSRKNGEKEFCAVINFFNLKQSTAAQTKSELDKVHGDTAPTLKTIYFWIEKGEDRFIGWKGDGHCFLGCSSNHPYWLFVEGSAIIGEYYTTVQIRLHEKLRTERLKLAHKKIFFYQDNAPTHTSAVLIAKVHVLGLKLLPHPPYSPDFTPYDFFLFPKLKIWLGEKKFLSDEEVIAAADEYFKGLETSYFSEGIKKLEERWTKCVEIEGDYVEK